MSAEWKDLDWGDCPSCSDGVQALTAAEDNKVYDGDAARCLTCDWLGSFAVEEENEDGEARAWLQDGNITELCWEHNKKGCLHPHCVELTEQD